MRIHGQVKFIHDDLWKDAWEPVRNICYETIQAEPWEIIISNISSPNTVSTIRNIINDKAYEFIRPD